MTDNIILFPNFRKLKGEVDKLRTELSILVLERDELRLVICKNIEMAYMLELGSLEYKVFEAQCAFMRLKRKAELIQAKKNKQEKIVISQIEYTLDVEFEEYQRKLDEQIDEMNQAIERSSFNVLSTEEAVELKKLYRRVIKILHPDLNPSITQAQLELFNKAVNAYDAGDLNTLRIIDEMISEPILSDNYIDEMTRLADEKERLIGLLKTVKESIENIKNEFPYAVKELLNDPTKIAERKIELKSIIHQYKELIDAYNARIEEMLR